MRRLTKDFLKCGVLGWCLEIVFTAMDSMRRRDPALKGNTSLWMFPIYGAGCLLRPVWLVVKKLPWFVRGGVYTVLIFCGEYLSGAFLRKKGRCPWDYGRSRFHVGRVIRLDFAPCWFATGLLMEQVVKSGTK